MIVNINDTKKKQKKKLAEKCFLLDNFSKHHLWSSLAFTKVNKCSQTNRAAVDSQHLKAEVAK